MKKTKSTTKININASNVGITIAAAVASSLVTAIVKSVKTSKKVTEKDKKIDALTKKVAWFEGVVAEYEKSDKDSDLFDDDCEASRETPAAEPEIVKVAERPSFDGTYEGTINTPEKTGDEEFDVLMNDALNILEKIEEDHYDISEKHNNFEDIAFSILNGIYIYKDELDEHKEDIEESVKKALKSFKTEDAYDYIPYASSSKAIRMHRDDMKQLCEKLLKYFEEKKEKENNAGNNEKESNNNISVSETGGETEESNSGNSEDDDTGSFINESEEE